MLGRLRLRQLMKQCSRMPRYSIHLILLLASRGGILNNPWIGREKAATFWCCCNSQSLHPPFCVSAWRLCVMTQHLGESQSIITWSKISPVPQKVSFSRRSTTISTLHAAPLSACWETITLLGLDRHCITAALSRWHSCFSHGFGPLYDN